MPPSQFQMPYELVREGMQFTTGNLERIYNCISLGIEASLKQKLYLLRERVSQLQEMKGL